MQAKKNIVKKSVDVCMTLILLFLMAYQVTGETLHEWIGIAETVLVIVHQILNRKWYAALFKGKYNPYRTVTTVINVLLIAAFLITAFCGMSMSGHAVPFLYGMAPVSFARRFHLSMSHWAFVLMGLHLGMHIPAMIAGFKIKEKIRLIMALIFACLGGYGLYLFIESGMPDYLFFKVPFAFLDYEKAGGLALLENLLTLIFWAFTGAQAANLCRILSGKKSEEAKGRKSNPLLPVLFILMSIVIGLVFNTILGLTGNISNGSNNWGGSSEQAAEQNTSNMEPEDNVNTTTGSLTQVEDGYILIPAGKFLMGSPDTENWRIDDETQHEVTVSAFYIDPYETTQEDYESVMGTNPSTVHAILHKPEEADQASWFLKCPACHNQIGVSPDIFE